jgi:hypothetical protein
MATEQQLTFAVRAEGLEVGIRGSHVIFRRAGSFAQMLREFCPTWMQVVLTLDEVRLAMAAATAHYSGGVLRVYRLGEPWHFLESVDNHYVALDFVEEVHRVNR